VQHVPGQASRIYASAALEWIGDVYAVAGHSAISVRKSQAATAQ
jgi:hypothetical protein